MNSKATHDIAKAISAVKAAAYNASCNYNDPHTQWGSKQDLYQLRWLLDSVIRQCPTFGEIEVEWLKQQKHSQLINTLKDIS